MRFTPEQLRKIVAYKSWAGVKPILKDVIRDLNQSNLILAEEDKATSEKSRMWMCFAASATGFRPIKKMVS